MNDAEKQVADMIREAFRGVTLGDGIGLRQGSGLDDYADDATLAEYRSHDEAGDWSRIDSLDLDSYGVALSYMDVEGMRFHLPAYLIADLEGMLMSQDILFHLSYTGSGDDSRFCLLNPAQRAAVRQFLCLRHDDPEYEFQSPMIANALEQYWDREPHRENDA